MVVKYRIRTLNGTALVVEKHNYNARPEINISASSIDKKTQQTHQKVPLNILEGLERTVIARSSRG